MSGADASRAVAFRWVGSEEAYLDQPALAECGSIVVGCYGGRTEAGARKNEDGALVWCDAAGAWEFAALLDAHFSAESAELILATLEAERPRLLAALAQPVAWRFGRFTRRCWRSSWMETFARSAARSTARRRA